jgi:transcriptional regulator with GAF, ATPase, and Fis domain
MADGWTALTDLAARLREPLDRQAQLDALAAALQRAFGWKQFSINRYDASTDETSRVYSTAPETWPVGGRKKRKTSGWSERVIDRGEINLSSTAAEVEAVFGDHSKIAAHGCASILNLPVRYDGRTLGALNLMHAALHYDGCDRGLALAFTALAVPLMRD